MILNVRLGFATNSSSSHSIIVLDDVNHGIQDEDVECFGRNFFTAASKKTKQTYFAIVLYSELQRFFSEKISLLLLNHICNSNYKHNFAEKIENFDLNVDHQSRFGFPMSYDKKTIDFEFVEEFYNFITKSNVLILGGDDCGENHQLYKKELAFKYKFLDNYYIENIVCRKDKLHGFWTIFNRESGAKIRMFFDSNKNVPLIACASTPELVDVKITDYCNENCPFCYQNSTSHGIHACFQKINYLIERLSELKVFEVAIGGGEPTAHPDFVEILKRFREKGIVPNFSTHSLTWLKGDNRQKIMDLIGSYAYTARDIDDINNLQRILTYYEADNTYFLKKCLINIVMGTVEKDDFMKMMQLACKLYKPVILLGYKETGRGSSYKPINYDWLPDAIQALQKSHTCPQTSIDTVLGKQFHYEWKKLLGISEKMYEIVDGKFSCYIDMVKQRIGPSSYCEPEEMVPLSDEFEGDEIIAAMKRTEEFLKKQIPKSDTERVHVLEIE